MKPEMLHTAKTITENTIKSQSKPNRNTPKPDFKPLGRKPEMFKKEIEGEINKRVNQRIDELRNRAVSVIDKMIVMIYDKDKK